MTQQLSLKVEHVATTEPRLLPLLQPLALAAHFSTRRLSETISLSVDSWIHPSFYSSVHLFTSHPSFYQSIHHHSFINPALINLIINRRPLIISLLWCHKGQRCLHNPAESEKVSFFFFLPKNFNLIFLKKTTAKKILIFFLPLLSLIDDYWTLCGRILCFRLCRRSISPANSAVWAANPSAAACSCLHPRRSRCRKHVVHIQAGGGGATLEDSDKR